MTHYFYNNRAPDGAFHRPFDNIFLFSHTIRFDTDIELILLKRNIKIIQT